MMLMPYPEKQNVSIVVAWWRLYLALSIGLERLSAATAYCSAASLTNSSGSPFGRPSCSCQIAPRQWELTLETFQSVEGATVETSTSGIINLYYCGETAEERGDMTFEVTTTVSASGFSSSGTCSGQGLLRAATPFQVVSEENCGFVVAYDIFGCAFSCDIPLPEGFPSVCDQVAQSLTTGQFTSGCACIDLDIPPEASAIIATMCQTGFVELDCADGHDEDPEADPPSDEEYDPSQQLPANEEEAAIFIQYLTRFYQDKFQEDYADELEATKEIKESGATLIDLVHTSSTSEIQDNLLEEILTTAFSEDDLEYMEANPGDLAQDRALERIQALLDQLDSDIEATENIQVLGPENCYSRECRPSLALDVADFLSGVVVNLGCTAPIPVVGPACGAFASLRTGNQEIKRLGDEVVECAGLGGCMCANGNQCTFEEKKVEAETQIQEVYDRTYKDFLINMGIAIGDAFSYGVSCSTTVLLFFVSALSAPP